MPIINLEDMTVTQNLEDSDNIFLVEMTVTEARLVMKELDGEAHEKLTDQLDEAQGLVFTDAEVATYVVIKITK